MFTLMASPRATTQKNQGLTLDIGRHRRTCVLLSAARPRVIARFVTALLRIGVGSRRSGNAGKTIGGSPNRITPMPFRSTFLQLNNEYVSRRVIRTRVR